MRKYSLLNENIELRSKSLSNTVYHRSVSHGFPEQSSPKWKLIIYCHSRVVWLREEFNLLEHWVRVYGTVIWATRPKCAFTLWKSGAFQHIDTIILTGTIQLHFIVSQSKSSVNEKTTTTKVLRLESSTLPTA